MCQTLCLIGYMGYIMSEEIKYNIAHTGVQGKEVKEVEILSRKG